MLRAKNLFVAQFSDPAGFSAPVHADILAGAEPLLESGGFVEHFKAALVFLNRCREGDVLPENGCTSSGACVSDPISGGRRPFNFNDCVCQRTYISRNKRLL